MTLSGTVLQSSPARIKPVPLQDSRFPCPSYRLSGLVDNDSLMAIYGEMSATHPHSRFLFTLDDLGQALYTSMHCRSSLDLDDANGLDLSVLPASCFDDGEYYGAMTHPAEFFIRERNCRQLVASARLEDAFACGLSLNDDDRCLLGAACADLGTVLDEACYLLQVPVTRACDTLFAFPNGYFACDLGPAALYALARHLEDEFGYRLCGLGAALVAFLPGRRLDANALASLCDVLAQLYGDDALRYWFAPHIDGRQLLVLKYTDG